MPRTSGANGGLQLDLGLGVGVEVRVQVRVQIRVRVQVQVRLRVRERVGEGLLSTTSHSIFYGRVGLIAIFSHCQP